MGFVAPRFFAFWNFNITLAVEVFESHYVTLTDWSLKLAPGSAGSPYEFSLGKLRESFEIWSHLYPKW